MRDNTMLHKNFIDNQHLKRRQQKLERALVKAVIPLEALKLSGSYKWISPELRQGIDDAILEVREVITRRE